MSEQPPDEVMSSIGAKIQTMVQIATEAATAISTRRAERFRAAADESARMERQRNDRLRSELAADKLVMRRVWDDRWWRGAELDQITKTWEVCASWADNGEPYGRVCLDQMREQIKARYGVDVAPSPDPLSRDDLSEILGADRDAATPAAGDAEDHPDPERSVRYVIRDPQTGQELASGREALVYDDRRPIELLAAERLLRFERDREDREDGGAARFVIDVYDSAKPGEDPAYTLAADRAESVREEILQRHERVLAGEESASPQERLDVLLVERQRIREDLDRLLPTDPRVEAARQALADHLDANPAADRRSPERERDESGVEDLTPDERAERVADLRERQARLGLRIEAAEAEVRGEDGAHVFEAATLRTHMDEDWWQTASADEVQAVYGHVEQWSEGQAKRTMLAQMQGDTSRHHGVDVGRGASAEVVGQELSRAQAEARGEGPAGREAEEHRTNATDADAEAEREDEAGTASDRRGEPDLADAQNEDASEDRAEAGQERDAAAALERIEQDDAEAANAVRGAAKSLRHSLRRRLRDGAGQQGETRRSRGSGRVLGRRPKPEAER